MLTSNESKVLIVFKLNDMDSFRSLLREFILLASGYTYPFHDHDSRRSSKECLLGFGYSIGGSGILIKDMYISTIPHIRTLLDLLQALNDTGFSRVVLRPSVLEEKVTVATEGEETKYYAMAHTAARQMLRFLYINQFKDEVRPEIIYRINIVDGQSSTAGQDQLSLSMEETLGLALWMTAIYGSISRHSLAMRQLAAQEILRLAYDSCILGGRDYGRYLDLYSDLLSVMTVDTYLWLPYHIYRLALVYKEELGFAVAAEPMKDVITFIQKYYQSSRDLLCAIENYHYRFRHEIRKIFKELMGSSGLMSFANFVKDFNMYYSNIVRDYLEIKEGRAAETLLGRLRAIAKEFERELEHVRGTSGGQTQAPSSGGAGERSAIYILTLTEQAGPPQVLLLADLFGIDMVKVSKRDRLGVPRRLVLIYTPQTYMNYMYITQWLYHIAGENLKIEEIEKLAICSEGDGVDGQERDRKVILYPVLAPSTEGLLVREIMKGLAGKLKECLDSSRSGVKVIALLQGLSMVSLPLYLELYELKRLHNYDISLFLT